MLLGGALLAAVVVVVVAIVISQGGSDDEEQPSASGGRAQPSQSAEVEDLFGGIPQQGVTLGEPISISEEGAPAPVFRGKLAAPMAAGAPVAQGEETLSVSVNVSWAIKPKAQ